MEKTKKLTGTHRVRKTAAAYREAARLLPNKRDLELLRRQAIKLRYWPEKESTIESGQVVDLDWCWIKSLPGKKIGELRIHDQIGGYDNLRVIFYVGNSFEEGGMPIVWILAVMHKKRNDFTKHNIETFEDRRSLVLKRFYMI